MHLTIPAGLTEDNSYYVRVNAYFRVAGLSGRFYIGLSPEGRSDRREHRGEPTIDLFGWMNPDSIAIAARRIPVAEPIFEVAVGDTITVADYGTFEIGAPTRTNDKRPQLIVVPS